MRHYIEGQQIFCLNRGWKFLEEDITVLPPTKQHNDVYSFAKAGAYKGPADAGFDDTSWEEVTLPHDWVTKHPFDETGSPNQGYKERGIAWYRVRFELPKEDAGKQILLDFEGMSCDAQIYVNGQILKHSYSGYNSMTVDMTDMAHFGIVPNTLAVRIDARAWEGWWYEGAGIYRNVWLIKKAPVHLLENSVWIKPVCEDRENPQESMWTLQIEAEAENSFELEEKVCVKSFLYDEAGKQLGECELTGKRMDGAGAVIEVPVKGYGKQRLTGSMQVKAPKLWSPESPALYKVVTRLYKDG